MKILKSWLKDYIEINESDEKLAELLNISGTEVENIESIDEKIIAAKILEIKPHPNADRLRIVKINTGKNELEIVCGAPNIEAGQTVPFAQLGTKFTDFEIKEAEIRGVKSQGMLCSEKELGISDDHSGIMILDENTKIGTPLREIIDTDSVFDLEITTNRGDCLSHIGIAREIAAITQKSITKKELTVAESDKDASKSLSVNIESNDCSQYFARAVEGVEIKESPEWLKKRLEKVGQKAINNVVDITNYIMMDLGHPLHAFDANKILGNKIIVRAAKEGETIITIDNEVKSLTPENLVIADEKNPIAIAGVMGGFDSEITNKTTKIILEAAEFDRKSIRKTKKALKMDSDASYRFERGIDGGNIEYAINKAAVMIKEIAGGNILRGIVKDGKSIEPPKVTFDYNDINSILGTNISVNEINKILESLGFSISNDVAIAPTWRHDIEVWQDLAEEVGRIFGYTKVPLIPIEKRQKASKSDYYFKEHIKDTLFACGFSETLNYPFLSEIDISNLNISTSDLIEVANPIQPENKYLRKSLLPGLLKNVAKNPSFDVVKLFEVGNVFTNKDEHTNLAFVVSGKKSAKIINETIDNISTALKIPSNIFCVSTISIEDANKYKIKKSETSFCEIGFEKLQSVSDIKLDEIVFALPKKTVVYRPVSKFPSLVRDLAFVVDKDTNVDDIINEIYDRSLLINRVELFDEFVSDKFGEGKKNIAFHIDLQHLERTLTDSEANKVVEEIVNSLDEKFRAKLRNY